MKSLFYMKQQGRKLEKITNPKVQILLTNSITTQNGMTLKNSYLQPQNNPT